MSKIYSMTGFAAGKTSFKTSQISCEIRSLNSRYLELFVKLPPLLRDMEDEVKELIRQKLQRGKINLSLSFDTGDPSSQSLKVNENAVRLYARLFDDIRRLANLEETARVSDFLEFKDVFVTDQDALSDKDFRARLISFLAELLDKLNYNREVEGANLRTDLEARLASILEINEKLTALAAGTARAEFDKLYQRLLSMISEQKVDRNRLEMEMAIISDRVDINEEIVRLESHIGLFRENLAAGSPIGKKLNFILQEMHREANTISSKSSQVEISHLAVTLKEEVERIREQVQNIE